jgi:hypothetical protein
MVRRAMGIGRRDLLGSAGGAEVGAWLRGELDRLHVQLASAAMPNAPGELISAAMFLEP